MASRREVNWMRRQRVSTAASAYPTPEQIAEFLEANRKGGAEAIAQLLREKQAKKAQEQQSQPIRELQPGDMEMNPPKKA